MITTKTAKQICEAVDDILSTIDTELFQDQAVNWGDLSCTEVREVKLLFPAELEPYIQVVIAEADPSAYKLGFEIQKQFEEKYGFKIYVEFEW